MSWLKISIWSISSLWLYILCIYSIYIHPQLDAMLNFFAFGLFLMLLYQCEAVVLKALKQLFSDCFVTVVKITKQHYYRYYIYYGVLIVNSLFD